MSRRSLFQAAYAPIVYRRAERFPLHDNVPDRENPGRPALEELAPLRALGLSADEWHGAARALNGPARTLAQALGAADVFEAVRVWSEVRGSDPIVANDLLAQVISSATNTRLEGIDRLLEQLETLVASAEEQLVRQSVQAIVRTAALAQDDTRQLMERIGRLLPNMPVQARGALARVAAQGDVEALRREVEHAEQANPPLEPVLVVRSGASLDIQALQRGWEESARRRLAPPATLQARVARLLAIPAVADTHRSAIQDILRGLGIEAPGDLDTVKARAAYWAGNAHENLKLTVPARPFGYLHLERLDFIPAGVEHGELVASFPLAPGEQISIVHKEWSNTSEEFTRIVQDQFEDYSETGVVDTTDASSSTTAQSTHGSSFSVSVSASGGYGPVSANVTASYSAQQSDTATRSSSLKQTNATTKKASARSRKEHRVSFRTAKRSGVEDETVRTIRNADLAHPVRYDIFQLIRRWRVNLRRYGIRLTYDLTLPEPASAMLAIHQEIQSLGDELEEGFSFDLAVDDVSRFNWHQLAAEAGISLDPPPPDVVSVEAVVAGTTDASQPSSGTDNLSIEAPDGYTFDGYYHDYMYGGGGQMDLWFPIGCTCVVNPVDGQTAKIEFLFGFSSPRPSETFINAVRAVFSLTDDGYRAWQVKCYQALAEAAHDRFLENRTELEQRRARLLADVNGIDALRLRKLEREELMKNVLRWLFGPGFLFSPPYNNPGYYDLAQAVSDPYTQKQVLAQGHLVSFLHQAFEWENLISFLYPYFWTSPAKWRDRFDLRHDDAIHEAFLRAGAVRVVLPIRPRWENALLSLLATGKVDSANHPYMTIAQEIENYADTNYPGIQAANPPDEPDPEASTEAAEGQLYASWYEYTPTSALDIKIGDAVPSEGAFADSTFAPSAPWWAQGATGDAVKELADGIVAWLDKPVAPQP